MNSCFKLVAKVKKNVFNLYLFILLCNYLQLLFSSFTASSTVFLPQVLLYLSHFSVFLLLFACVKLGSSFCYQVLAEVCKFWIIFLNFFHYFVIVCMFFVTFIKKNGAAICITLNEWLNDIKNLCSTICRQYLCFSKITHL